MTPADTIEILEGLTKADGGEVRILGLNWEEHERELRERIGVSLQETQLAEKIIQVHRLPPKMTEGPTRLE